MVDGVQVLRQRKNALTKCLWRLRSEGAGQADAIERFG